MSLEDEKKDFLITIKENEDLIKQTEDMNIVLEDTNKELFGKINSDEI